MAFTDLKDNETYLKLIAQGMGEGKARAIFSQFEVLPEDVNDAIRYLVAENLELLAHIHIDEALAEELRDKYPTVEPKCFDIPLGDGFKWAVIYALTLYRDAMLEEIRQGGN